MSWLALEQVGQTRRLDEKLGCGQVPHCHCHSPMLSPLWSWVKMRGCGKNANLNQPHPKLQVTDELVFREMDSRVAAFHPHSGEEVMLYEGVFRSFLAANDFLYTYRVRHAHLHTPQLRTPYARTHNTIHTTPYTQHHTHTGMERGAKEG